MGVKSCQTSPGLLPQAHGKEDRDSGNATQAAITPSHNITSSHNSTIFKVLDGSRVSIPCPPTALPAIWPCNQLQPVDLESPVHESSEVGFGKGCSPSRLICGLFLPAVCRMWFPDTGMDAKRTIGTLLDLESL